MDIKTLQKDMIAAMKNKDKPRKESISALIQAVRKWLLMKDAEMTFQQKWLTE